MKNPPLESYLQRRNPGRPYLVLFLITLAVFTVIIFRVLAASENRLRFIVINEDTILLSQEKHFLEVGEFHVGQAERVTLAMLNRGPKGVASDKELKRMLDGPSFRKLQARLDAETPEFLAKQTRQVVEISETKIQKKEGRIVEAKVFGQLIQYGSFDGRLTVEVYELEIWMRLVHNSSLVDGGRYPLIVGDFEITTNLVTAR
ncbi:MAG: hypothetical protein ACJAQT_000085 [Akkermansiaceae bacterium]|jgi:hypothetical protein